MNKYEPSDELRDQLVESLLQSVYETDATDRDRDITAVLDRIDEEPSTSSPLVELPNRQRTRLPRWIPISVAALALFAILLAFPFSSSDTSGQALAAVQRSIEASKESVLRHYRISKTRKTRQGKRTVENDLYVQGADKFAVSHPALRPNGNVWLGSDGKEAWLVPAFGPVRVGNETGLGKWMAGREEMASPILQLDTVLARLKDGYKLTQKPDETLTTASGSAIECQYLVGELLLKNKGNYPEKIHLWCAKDSGVTIRMKAHYVPSSDRWNRIATTIDFVDEPELEDDWFEPKGHYQGFRRTLRFDSEEEPGSSQDGETNPAPEASQK